MSYPILYKSNETDFSHLGLGVLSDTTSALVEEVRNGQFELVMKYPIDGINFKEIKNDRLIKVDASKNLKSQRFKIIRITKPAKGLVTIYAEHSSYLTQDLPLEPEVQYSGDATTALNIWKNNIVDDHAFTVYSDILTQGSGKWVISEVENARKALGGVQGSILDSYGGEYRFDNYHIGLYSQRGNDSGALIAYGKNLTDLEQEEEIASTYTSIYPFVTINEDDKEEILVLPERFIDSEYVDNYARRKILTVDFSSEEITTVAQLRARAQRYIKDNDVGIPKVNLRVKFIDLAKTLDYKNLKLVEEINLCDLVTVYFEKLGIMQKAKVIKTVWDVLLDRYDSIEIGESRASLSDSVNTIVDGKVDRIDDKIDRVQIAANGKNKIFRGPTEPTTGMNKNDLWYKPVGDGEVEMYQYDGTQWRLAVSTAVNSKTKAQIDGAKSIAENARDKAQSTIDNIDGVVKGNGFTTLSDLFASKLATDKFGTMFYQQSDAIGLTYEEDGETKAIIAISEGMPYIKGEHIVLDGDTVVDGTFTVTDEIFAKEMSIDKFTTGTLNAANVNIINMNVNNLVGNISDFVKSYWNAINSRASIDGNELRFTHDDGSYTSLRAAGLMRYDAGTGKKYHHLTKIIKFSIGGDGQSPAVRWIPMGTEFNNIDWSVALSISDSMNATSIEATLHRMVLTQGHDSNNNVLQPRFRNGQWEYPVTGYTTYYNHKTDSRRYSDLAGIMIVTA